MNCVRLGAIVGFMKYGTHETRTDLFGPAYCLCPLLAPELRCKKYFS